MLQAAQKNRHFGVLNSSGSISSVYEPNGIPDFVNDAHWMSLSECRSLKSVLPNSFVTLESLRRQKELQIAQRSLFCLIVL